MKYIRTKDGRIFDTSEISVPYLIIGNWLDFNSQGRFEILKQADIVEELCDGVYVEDKNNPHNWFVMEISEYKNTSNKDKKYMVKDWNFYAFIKTSKGLIYVAKMNEKGELE